jgi:hypothetical protein
MNGKNIVKTYYYDLGEVIKNKFGEFLPPIEESIIIQKNVLISHFQIDNANQLSIFPIKTRNVDVDGTEHVQSLTTNEPLKNIQSKAEVEKVTKFIDDKKGALPLLNVKFNPFYYQAQMEIKSIKEMRKANTNTIGGYSLENILIFGGIAVVIIIAVYAVYTGAIKF